MIKIESPEEVDRLFKRERYVTTPDVTLAVFLALSLNKPLLIEGEPGCGKTEIAKVLSKGLDTALIRLQCHEGLDSNDVLYEWDYMRQLVKIKIEEGKNIQSEEIESKVYDEKYLLKRPLLSALLYSETKSPVLLIDEIDRADEEFEGFLLEFLAEYQVTIPEIGTIHAKNPPITILTSNRTRELGDGLRRRCLYLYIDYPSIEKEVAVLELKVPHLSLKLRKDIPLFMRELREIEGLAKRPGIAESLDWAAALVTLNKKELDPETVEKTLNCILKSQDDIKRIRAGYIGSILAKINETSPTIVSASV
jgi:MoxR-like ATPase